MMENKGQIIIFQTNNGNIKLEVNIQNETVWLTQEQMSLLFKKAKSTISQHVQNIYQEEEVEKISTVRDFRTVRLEGNREVERNLEHYNLEVIISVGYRVKSMQGTQFRIWATQRLKEHIIKGFTLNDERFKSGNSMNYFNELQERIREIRLSERFFYQKIKDIYITSLDYDSQNEETINFFKIVQNKLLWAISKKTAAELIFDRIDANLPHLGMYSYDNTQKIRKSDISTAKNYLNEEEMKLLGLLVEQYLAFAETMAQQKTPMYMENWIKQLDVILKMNNRELLMHAGKISNEMAKKKSEKELKKYKNQQKLIEKKESLKELEQDIKRLKNNTNTKFQMDDTGIKFNTI